MFPFIDPVTVEQFMQELKSTRVGEHKEEADLCTCADIHLIYWSFIMPALLYNYWWALILLGVLAGIVSGTLGLGSGIVVIPVLVLLFGFGQKSAQGTALAVMVPMTLVGALRYWKNPEIDMSLTIILLIVLGALVGVLAGTELACRLPNQVLRKVFAIFLVVVAVRMFIASPKPIQPKSGTNLMNQNNANLVDPGYTKNEAKQQ
jgi:uncharacterized membrane protein YfcA